MYSRGYGGGSVGGVGSSSVQCCTYRNANNELATAQPKIDGADRQTPLPYHYH